MLSVITITDDSNETSLSFRCQRFNHLISESELSQVSINDKSDLILFSDDSFSNNLHMFLPRKIGSIFSSGNIINIHNKKYEGNFSNKLLYVWIFEDVDRLAGIIISDNDAIVMQMKIMNIVSRISDTSKLKQIIDYLEIDDHCEHDLE